MHHDDQRLRSHSTVSDLNHVRQIGAAFAAFRRDNKRGSRVPLGLRKQVVAALEAGVSGSELQKACKLSWSQVTRWRSAAHAGSALTSAPQVDVLSVVDALAPSLDSDVSVRIGPWCISVSRVAN